MEKGHKFDTDGYNLTADALVEVFRKRSPQAAARHYRFLKLLEDSMDKQGTPVPKHSHRFLPENLWPDGHN